MNKKYPYQRAKKKKYYKKWRDGVPGWKKRKLISYAVFLFMLLGWLAIILAFIIGVNKEYLLTSIAGGFFSGLVFAILPFFIGTALYMRWNLKYGAPFSAMTKEFLLATEYGLEFGYVRKVWNDWNMAEVNRRVVFRIRFAEIEFMDLDQGSNICTIGGCRGRITMYDDPAMQAYQPYNSYELSPNEAFKFIFAFRDQEEFVERLKSEINEGVWGKKPDGLI